MVSIEGLDKKVVLKQLWAKSHSQGMSVLHERTPNDEDMDRALEGRAYVDYFCGRVIKVDLSGDEFDPRFYDRDNYDGAAHDAIEELRTAA